MTLRDDIARAAADYRAGSEKTPVESTCQYAEFRHRRGCCNWYWCEKLEIAVKGEQCETCIDRRNPGEPAPPPALLSITLIINTCNEGPDVRETIRSFREHCRGLNEVIVVADGTTDGSCNELGRGVKVLVNKDPVGCGRAKAQATKEAHGDVLIYADGHMRVLRGSLDDMAQAAMERQAIVCPGLGPLHCPPEEQPKPDHKTKNVTYGANLYVSGAGCKVELSGRPTPKAEVVESQAASWACWAIPMKVMRERLCGWNKYPGRWGSQELGLTLRAWFSETPILVYTPVIVLHRYRDWRPGPNRLLKTDAAYYHIPRWHERVNSWYAVGTVFDTQTFADVWTPILGRTTALDAEAKGALKKSTLGKQRKRFAGAKARTDAEFFHTWCKDGLAPTPMIPRADITAVLLNYRRPEAIQRCVKSLKDNGVNNIWCWNQENVEAPVDVSLSVTCEKNLGTWPRYALAPMVNTPWVLFLDDDCEITKWGLSALREYAGRYANRVLGLIGCVFDHPFDNYNRRHFYKSHKIHLPMEVDFVWPKGLLAPTGVLQRIYGCAEEFNAMKQQLGTPTGDDLLMSVCLQRLGLPPALIVPSWKGGYKEGREAGDKNSLSLMPGRLSKKRAMLREFRKSGYRPLRAVEYQKGESEFDRAWAWLMENGVGVKQTRAELEWACGLIKQREPEVFVEVGALQGGTLYAYAHHCRPGATIVAIDPSRTEKDAERLAYVIEALRTEGYCAEWIRDKTTTETGKAALSSLVPDGIDLVHIDGDHKYQSVSGDFELLATKINKGGLCLLHDIASPLWDVSRFWLELTELMPCTEMIEPGPPIGSPQGIGVVFF